MWTNSDLELVVLLLKFSAKLLQFGFHASLFAQLLGPRILFLLQLVRTLLILSTLSFPALNIGKVLCYSLLQDFDLLQVVHL